MVPLMFSMMLVQASERHNSAGKVPWHCEPREGIFD
jgi:hypothetical protein